MLYLIGLGLSFAEDITIRGLKAIQKCDRVYLEHYTSIHMAALVKDLEELYGKKVILADREMVEQSSDVILEDGKTKNIAFLVVGDVFGATTHTDLVIRARELGIEYECIHNASVMNAVGACGLQLYSFGQTVLLVFFTDLWKPDLFYDRIKDNANIGVHTLILLDIKVKEQTIENMMRGNNIFEPPRYMSIDTAAKQLLEIEELRQEGVYNENSICVAVSRLGSPTQKFKVDTLKNLTQYDAGEPLHSMVLVGSKVHELELQFMAAFYDGTYEELKAHFEN